MQLCIYIKEEEKKTTANKNNNNNIDTLLLLIHIPKYYLFISNHHHQHLAHHHHHHPSHILLHTYILFVCIHYRRVEYSPTSQHYSARDSFAPIYNNYFARQADNNTTHNTAALHCKL